MTIPSKIEIEAYCTRITIEAGVPPLKKKDAEEYEEKEFELLKEDDTEEYEEEEFQLLNVAISPVKVKAE